MKRRYAAMILGLALAFSSMTVYAEAENSAEEAVTETVVNEETQDAASETEGTYGEVTAVAEDGITIATGTWNGPGNGNGGRGMNAGEAPADGELPADGEAPADGELPADGEAPTDDELPADGGVPADGETPGGMDSAASFLELDGGEVTVSITENTVILKNGNRAGGGEMPDGEVPTDGEAPVDGEAPADGEAPDDGAASADGEAPLAEDIVEGDSDEGAPELPEGGFNGGEEIALSDIQNGDIIRITYDEDGNAATITVVMSSTTELPEGDAETESTAE